MVQHEICFWIKISTTRSNNTRKEHFFTLKVVTLVLALLVVEHVVYKQISCKPYLTMVKLLLDFFLNLWACLYLNNKAEVEEQIKIIYTKSTLFLWLDFSSTKPTTHKVGNCGQCGKMHLGWHRKVGEAACLLYKVNNIILEKVGRGLIIHLMTFYDVG